MAETRLLDRKMERVRLDEMTAALRAGESRVLVLLGAPGIGKSALLDYARESAVGIRTLRAVGVQSEMELPFASLHQLCSPLFGRLDRLTELRREALETVFRMRVGPPPDQFLVGLAVLDLLADASEAQPLLCLVDDAQWLDRASAQVLGFTARRLLAESIGLLFAARQPGPELRGLVELEITGLRDADAEALLASATRVRLDRHIRDRIVAETHGNPLALLELPRGLTATQMAGGLGLLTADSVSGRIEATFLKRIQDLPERARRLLLVAAAEPVGDPDLVAKAAERLNVDLTTALTDAADLLKIEERVTFRHPLVRSAIYQAAKHEDRRAAHRALAEVTDPQTAPDRRAWHLAAAVSGPDEAVAQELQRSADRAQARGGVAAAAAFLHRSVALTADSGQRVDRMLSAAETSLQAGELDDVRRILGALDATPLDDFQAGRAGVLAGQTAFAARADGDAVPLLLTAAERFTATNPRLARETYLTAWGMAINAADRDSIMAVSSAVRGLRASADLRPLDLLLEGLALLVTDGRAAAAATLQQAATVLLDLPVGDVLRWGWVAAAGFNGIWDSEGSIALSSRQVQVVRDAGAVRELPFHLLALSNNLIWIGDFEGAAAAIAEGEDIAAATGYPLPPYMTLQLQSLRGREMETTELIAATVQSSAASGFGAGLQFANWAGAILYNGLARYPDAVHAARAAPGKWDPFLSVWILPELVEAASRTGDVEVARHALDQLTQATRPFHTDFARGMEARTRALMADGLDAENLYRDAIERLSRTRLRPEVARAHLLYGEWLRRHRKRTESREHLRTAYEMFLSIGMAAFAERTRRELLATGDVVRRRATQTPAGEDLTAQELQIALLVRDGLSNPEIGARLFLSPRTVEWHLRKIFTKLSISSRRQLRDALPPRGAPTAG